MAVFILMIGCTYFVPKKYYDQHWLDFQTIWNRYSRFATLNFCLATAVRWAIHLFFPYFTFVMVTHAPKKMESRVSGWHPVYPSSQNFQMHRRVIVIFIHPQISIASFNFRQEICKTPQRIISHPWLNEQ